MKLRLLFFIAVALFAFSEQASYAQTNDFFSSTTGSNNRFKNNPDPAAAATNCLTCSGWNPCNGITSTGGSSCDGNGLLRQSTLGPVNGDGTQYLDQVGFVGPRLDIKTKNSDNSILTVKATPLFGSLGPGAVTDNMFGAIADPTQTDVLIGTTQFGKGPRAPNKCGNTNLTDGSFDPTMDTGVRSGLNCGYLRYDPTTQGLTLPPSDNSYPLGGQLVSLTTMTKQSGNILIPPSTVPGTCVLAYNVDGAGNSTTPKVPRAANTGVDCDGVNFNAPAHAFTSIPFGFGNPQPNVSIPVGLFNEFTFSRSVVCNNVTLDTTCVRQSLIQETQTENGTSHAEWAFLWSTKNVNPAGASSPANAACGDPINGVAQNTGGKICVHWYSDYEDSPCKIIGTYSSSVGSCRGVATGYGFLDVSEGYFLYNGDAAGQTSVSYPMGPQMSFGDIPAAVSP